MQEIELKFLVPELRLKGLMRQAKVKSSQVTQMAAHYYDTPDQQLAQAGIGLRIRREGNTWVQTIKAGGDGIAARLEHNLTLDNEQVQAMLDNNDLMPDLSTYKDTTIAPALAAFKLKKLAKKLTRLYVTDVERTTRLLIEAGSNEIDVSDNSIEVAYDHGEIIHGGDDTQRDAIQEIEFELVSGDLDFLFATAKVWCKRYKLCLSTVTKAERGGLLIKGQHHSPATSANLSELNINKDSSMPAFLRAIVHNCLLQILPNSSAIVSSSTDHEHVLQLYIGICRLRTALSAFASFSDEVNPDWLLIIKQTATLLSDYYDLSYLATHIEPMLQKHGAPMVDWTADVEAIKTTPIDAVSANDFQLTLLELIAFTMSDPSLEPQADKIALDHLTKTLSKQQAKFLKTEERLNDVINAKPDSLDSTSTNSTSTNSKNLSLKNNDKYQAQQQLHYQLNNLRYMGELAAPLYGKKKTKRWLKRVVKAQKSLGKQVDMTYYQQCYQHKALTDLNALYGVGWFAAILKDDSKRLQKQLDRIEDCATFW
ncbi:CYTH and CHAD domain-containing protein [Psychrobacter sp. DAB_AL32B]|uniref:CYTH and CHAD domain-containing protein n=1 Tax=Psychrobacter sp. DAB_AL32B TaxID=1028414 RepID=UPI000B7CF081|nr:CYTH and CHAD domain-containing protein [Psychrobacter sp. DAB_AL32B]OXL27684.1 inorganic triphosphatase [Psychrobacter sp. DAB_AL32B]